MVPAAGPPCAPSVSFTSKRMIRHPIFIVGMPRSGTTLLSKMLDAHPDIVISPETQFFSLSPFDVTEQGKAAAQTGLQFLLQQPDVQKMDFTDAEIRQVESAIDGAPAPGAATAFEALVRTYADRFQVEAWGEKTPDHLEHVPTIARLFPNAVFVGIVRDVRDVCLSLRGLPWNRDTMVESVWKWRRYVQKSETYQQTFSDRYYEVRYEDLVMQPGEVLKSICRFLNAPFSPRMLAFYSEGAEAFSAEPWTKNANRPVDSSNVEKWRNQMSGGEQWLIQTLAGKHLKRKGYPVPPVSLRPAHCADLWRVLRSSVQVVMARVLRKWARPSGMDRDYRPVWVRRHR